MSFDSLPAELQALILARLPYKQLKTFQPHFKIPVLTWKLHFEFYFSQVHRPYFDYQKEIEAFHWFIDNNANPSIVIFAAQRSYEIILEKELQKPDLSILKVKDAFSDCLRAKQYHLVDVFLKYYPNIKTRLYCHPPREVYIKISKNIMNNMTWMAQEAIDTNDVELLKHMNSPLLYLEESLKSPPCLKYLLSLGPSREEVLNAIEVAKAHNYKESLCLLSEYKVT